jgi:peptidoglycan/xylan/chitin deacetylase (PgdA/CDA1 family)
VRLLRLLLVTAAVALWVGRRQPPWLARLLARRSRRVLFAVPTTERAVALTFDDGPHPELSPALLDVLARQRARATFFLLGSETSAHPDLVARMVEEGHEVANHTWADRPSVLLGAAAFERDVERTHRALVEAGGEPRFLRPGSGWVRPSMLRTAERHGYRLVLGSVAVLHLRVSDVQAQARFVLDRVQPGAVVVLHEGYAERADVVPLTDRVLTGLRERGYEAVTLSELSTTTSARTPSSVRRAGEGLS